MSNSYTPIRHSRRHVFTGFKLDTNGIVSQTYFQEQELRRAISPPVLWRGQVTTLYFWNYVAKTPINTLASDLITHNGFIIRGPAIVVTGSERWYHFRVPGTEQQVQARLDHILHGLFDEVIFRPSGRWQTHQNVYVRNDDDAFAVRMVL